MSQPLNLTIEELRNLADGLNALSHARVDHGISPTDDRVTVGNEGVDLRIIWNPDSLEYEVSDWVG